MRQFGFPGMWMRDLLIGTTGFLLAWLILYMVYYAYRTTVAKKQVHAIPSVLAFALVMFIFTLPYPAFLLERPLHLWAMRLEQRHPVVTTVPDTEPLSLPSIVLVLGGGVIEPGRLNSQSLRRLDHGIALWHSLPDAVLLLTEGGLGRTGGDGGLAIGRYIAAQGIPPERMLMETRAATTRHNMIHSIRLLRDVPHGQVVLVTDARHMPRAHLAARRAGLSPTVAPVTSTADLRFYPRWQALSHLSAVLNEYVGMLGYFAADWI